MGSHSETQKNPQTTCCPQSSSPYLFQHQQALLSPFQNDVRNPPQTPRSVPCNPIVPSSLRCVLRQLDERPWVREPSLHARAKNKKKTRQKCSKWLTRRATSCIAEAPLLLTSPRLLSPSRTFSH